jgi:excisionase family DNA binding protein
VTTSAPDDELFAAIREEYPPVLTTAQVSQLLNVGPRTVLGMAADGRLKASRIPGTRQYNFFRDDVIRVLAQNIARPEEIEVDEAPAAAPVPSSSGRRRRKS